MKKNSMMIIALVAFCALKNQAQTISDYDGNVYNTVIIGNQVWMQENLKVTHYRNGISIPNITDITTWAGLTTGARCYYNNDSIAHDSLYGALYNWYAVHDVNGICPEGWHVSGDSEWNVVETFLGGSFVAGGKMKESGTSHWLNPNTGATNESGFTGLPGGMRGMDNAFSAIHENGLWWTSTQTGSNAWSRYLYYLNTGVDRNPTPKRLGLSIRCIKEVNVGLGNSKYFGNIKLYPNPASHKFIIECNVTQFFNLEVYDVSGKLLIHSVLMDNTDEIDISSLAKGIYLIKLIGDSLTFQQKFVKE